MLLETRHSRYLEETIKIHISNVLTSIETDIDLLVTNANGRHTDY